MIIKSRISVGAVYFPGYLIRIIERLGGAVRAGHLGAAVTPDYE